MLKIRFANEEMIRVFLVIDVHCCKKIDENIKLEKLKKNLNQKIEVYILGIGENFPVDFCVDLRSRFKNSKATIPILYSITHPDDVSHQFRSVSKCLHNGKDQLTLSIPGSTVPCFREKLKFQSKTIVYFKNSQEQLKDLKITGNSDTLVINPTFKRMDCIYSINSLIIAAFQQWINSYLVKRFDDKLFKRKVIPIMESIVKDLKLNDYKNKSSIAQRTQENIYDNLLTLTNEIGALTIDESYSESFKSDVFVAKAENKVSRFLEFRDKYIEIYQSVKRIDEFEYCKETKLSTISDLKDYFSFTKLFSKGTWSNFMDIFALTGTPVLIPISNEECSWNMEIYNVLEPPYEMLCQRTFKNGVDMLQMNDVKYDIMLKDDDENSRFNSIIPLFSGDAANTLKPLLLNKLFSECCELSIFRNNKGRVDSHIAALGCLWLKIISEFKSDEKPAYISEMLTKIIETSEIYIDLPHTQMYVFCFMELPEFTLSGFYNRTEKIQITSDTLLKPIYLISLYALTSKLQFSQESSYKYIASILIELFVRYFHSKYKNIRKIVRPFSRFFTKNLKTIKNRRSWIRKAYNDNKRLFESTGVDFGEDVFLQFREILRTKIRLNVLNEYNNDDIESDDDIGNDDDDSQEYNIGNDIDAIKEPDSCVSFLTIKKWLDYCITCEIFCQESITRIKKNILIFLYYGMKYKDCEDVSIRMASQGEMNHFRQATIEVRDAILNENAPNIRKYLRQFINDATINQD